MISTLILPKLWQSGTPAIYAELIGGQLDREDVKDYTMARNIIGERTWMQNADGRYDVALERFEEAA